MKWLDSSEVRLMLIGFIVTFLLSAAIGQTENSNVESAGITAAGPRLGTIVVVEVTIPNRDALDKLAGAGYDISNVQGNVVTIYASLEELERLKQTGYPLREIDRQPQPEGFELMALGVYHNYDTLTDELNAYAEAYPDICRLYRLGQSVQGRELWAVLISDNPDDEEDEPEFKYVSTIHGDENLSTEMCLYFIDLLLMEYGTDERITNLVDSTAIWIVPLMNPDGLVSSRRQNANGIDLNRNFPLLTDNSLNIFTGEPLDDTNRQPEVQHIMNWTTENSFVLSAGFHTGALLVCYPYGYNEQMSAVDTPTPDDLLYEEISRRYSMHNPPMWNSSQFPDGIINSALWYPVRGEMADWNYRYVSCNEVTIELSNNFRPPSSQIPNLWSNNKESMLSFLEAIHIGVRGLITDRASGEPLWAEVWVKGNSHPVFTDPDVGDYHRMLLPGIYDLIFNVPGYVPRSAKNITVTDGFAIRLDVELIPKKASPDFNRDGKVDIKDLMILIEHWGQDEPSVDIAPLPDGDGVVDSEDLALLMEYWQEEIPEFGLVAHWRLDETEGSIAKDSGGHNDGTLFGEPLWQPADGQVDGALKFDGIDDYVETDFVLNPADGPFSVFVWVKGGAPGQVVISQRGGVNWLCADTLEGNLMTELKGSGRGAAIMLSQAVITDGNWHRIALVGDGSHRTLYVDDAAVAEDTQTNLEGSNNGLYIGTGKAMEGGTFWTGLIDDVRIYNRAVTP
ncbi:MAG TPA: M14 family zinc carboxypeptidase [Sedimentisphaerales bacterium]|nr:M14 family zinc carboxypeptidase [Sedimentisphaerales bacterium]